MTTAEEYILQGVQSAQQGDLIGALAAFNQAITLTPDQAHIYHNRGNVYFLQGDFNNAMSDYSEAIRLAPNTPEVAETFYRRGSARASLGDTVGAISDFTETVTRDPKNAYAFAERGNLHNALGNSKLALDDIGMALHLDGANPQFHMMYGFACANAGNFADAIEHFDNAVNYGLRGDPNAHFYRAMAHLQRKDKTDADFITAANDFKIVLRAVPTHPKAPMMQEVIDLVNGTQE